MNFLVRKTRGFWIFCFKIMFFEKVEKMQNMPFLGVTWFNMWFFICTFFQYLARFKVINSKSDTLYKFYLKTWHVIKVFVQNLTLPKIFCFKYWHFVNVWICNLMLLKLLNSKSNSLYIKTIKTIHELKIWNQNLTGCNIFNSKLVFTHCFDSSIRFVTWKKGCKSYWVFFLF